MTTIYHNNRCRKSRETLAILEDKKEEIQIVNYLETPPTEKELAGIIKLLDISPLELVRKNEQIWKDNYKGKEHTDAELISIMHQNPKLIERPIVIKNGKAVLGRPPENVTKIL